MPMGMAHSPVSAGNQNSDLTQIPPRAGPGDEVKPQLSEEANFQLHEQVLQVAGQNMPPQPLLGIHGARHCGSAKRQ